jgi:hypothetical protein
VEGVRQALGDVCIFDYMEDATFRQENTDFFCFFASMKNSDLLPRSKVVSFFTESSSRSSTSDGPPPAVAALASPPTSGDVNLLIHLDHYYDWSPHPKGSSSSDVSGIPASSSEASSGSPHPIYKSFTWYLSVVDDQTLGRSSGPCMIDPCRRSSSRDHRDDELEDDGHGPTGGATSMCATALLMTCIGEALFAAATKVTVHDGCTMCFWSSSWLNGKATAALFPSLFIHSKRKNRTVANAMDNDNWLADLMHDMSATLLAKVTLIWIEVDATHFDICDREPDEIEWTRTTNKRYSVSSAYHMQFDGSMESAFPAKVW